MSPRIIRVKFAPHPVTGAGRYRATGGGRVLHLPSDSADSFDGNRQAAANALAAKMGWSAPVWQRDTMRVATCISHYLCK